EAAPVTLCADSAARALSSHSKPSNHASEGAAEIVPVDFLTSSPCRVPTTRSLAASDLPQAVNWSEAMAALQFWRCQRQGSAKRVGGRPDQRAVFSATGSLTPRAVQKEILEDEPTVPRTERLVTD